jgi:hypothetical protein
LRENNVFIFNFVKGGKIISGAFIGAFMGVGLGLFMGAMGGDTSAIEIVKGKEVCIIEPNLRKQS